MYCSCSPLYTIALTQLPRKCTKDRVCAHINQIQQLETALGRGTMAVSGRMGFPSSLCEVLPPMHVENLREAASLMGEVWDRYDAIK